MFAFFRGYNLHAYMSVNGFWACWESVYIIYIYILYSVAGMLGLITSILGLLQKSISAPPRPASGVRGIQIHSTHLLPQGGYRYSVHTSYLRGDTDTQYTPPTSGVIQIHSTRYSWHMSGYFLALYQHSKFNPFIILSDGRQCHF